MTDERAERLAVSLEDLDRVPSELRARLLAGRLDLDRVMRHAGQHRHEDVPAVAFSCDLLTAATIVDLLRNQARKSGDEPIRAFVRRGEAWTRVTLSTVLTAVTDDGRVVLNPAEFPPSARTSFGPAPPVKKVAIGRRS